jgi:hypothetical protein
MPSRNVVYDRSNRELRTIVDHFAANAAAVSIISWRVGVKKGATIAVGQTLAEVRWADGEVDPIVAPSGCEGTVAFTNRAIKVEDLHLSPSQVLLRVK